jgi:WD40 repeat protein
MNQVNHICTYLGHKAGVNVAALSPDGACVASASGDQTIHIWNVRTAKTLRVRQISGVVNRVVWSPDGKYFAAAKWDHSVQVWDAQSGALLYTYTGHTDRVYALAWSPDGKLIASGGLDKTAQVWAMP